MLIFYILSLSYAWLQAPIGAPPSEVYQNSRADQAFQHFDETIAKNAIAQRYLAAISKRGERRFHFHFDQDMSYANLNRFKGIVAGQSWTQIRYSQVMGLMYQHPWVTAGAFYTLAFSGIGSYESDDYDGDAPDPEPDPRPEAVTTMLFVAGGHLAIKNYVSVKVGYSIFAERLATAERSDKGPVYTVESPIIHSYGALLQSLRDGRVLNAIAALQGIAQTIRSLRDPEVDETPVDGSTGYHWSSSLNLHSQDAELYWRPASFRERFDGFTLEMALRESVAINRPRLNYASGRVGVFREWESDKGSFNRFIFYAHLQYVRSEVLQYLDPGRRAALGVCSEISMQTNFVRAGFEFSRNCLEQIRASPILVDANYYGLFFGGGF